MPSSFKTRSAPGDGIKKKVVEALRAEGWAIHTSNFSKQLNGERSLPMDLAKAAARIIGWTIPNQTNVWYGRPEVPVIPLGEIPMSLDGSKIAKAFDGSDRKLPDWTGHKSVYYVEIDEPAFHYQAGWIVFVAPHGKPVPGKRVLVRADERQFIAKYQIGPSGPQVADAQDRAYAKFDILGVIVGHADLNE